VFAMHLRFDRHLMSLYANLMSFIVAWNRLASE